MHRIAILLPDDALADCLGSHPRQDVFVIDKADLGFTRGMHEAWKIARAAGQYDAFWFLNSGACFDHSVLPDLVDVLFSDDSFAQVSPQFQSPHKFMECATQSAQRVPYLQPAATLIKASTLDTIGFWDLDLTHGWGVDYDYGFRIRQAGLSNILTNRARITFHENQSAAHREKAGAEMHAVLARKYGLDWERRIVPMHQPVPVILTCDRDLSVTGRFVESFRTLRGGLEKPVVIVDTSGSNKISRAFLDSLASLEPKIVAIHPRQHAMSLYDSVQDAAAFALATALEETGPDNSCLFMEDDITFSSQFLRRLGQVNTTAGFGFLTFYLPGDGFGAQPEFDPNRFYGTQCVLFPRESIELLVRERDEMHSHFPPGYDIRWSRFLAAKGYALHATEHSYVQHLSTLSRLHGEGTHVSNRFVP